MLTPVLPTPLAVDCLLELGEIVAEITALRPPAAVWAAPGEVALLSSELRLIRIMITLQRSDVVTALEALTEVLGPTRIGGALFPIKSLAARLTRAGIMIGAIGERQFRVILGGEATSRSPERRPELKVAR